MTLEYVLTAAIAGIRKHTQSSTQLLKQMEQLQNDPGTSCCPAKHLEVQLESKSLHFLKLNVNMLVKWKQVVIHFFLQTVTGQFHKVYVSGGEHLAFKWMWPTGPMDPVETVDSAESVSQAG